MPDDRTQPAGNKARIQTALLRVGFVISLGWALLFPMASIVEERIYFESYPFLRDAISFIAAFGGAFFAAMVAYRYIPGFLRVTRAVPATFLITRTLLYFPITLLALTAFFAVIELMHLRETGDPTNPQYGMSVLFVALWYPALLAPAATICAVWLAARRKS